MEDESWVKMLAAQSEAISFWLKFGSILNLFMNSNIFEGSTREFSLYRTEKISLALRLISDTVDSTSSRMRPVPHKTTMRSCLESLEGATEKYEAKRRCLEACLSSLLLLVVVEEARRLASSKVGEENAW